MRYKLSVLMISICCTALFSACQSAGSESKPETANQVPAVTYTPTNSTSTSAPTSPASASPEAPKDGAPRISLEEAKKAYDKGGTLFIDTRAQAAYDVEHITGAINIPVETIEDRYTEIPKDKKVIAYCS